MRSPTCSPVAGTPAAACRSPGRSDVGQIPIFHGRRPTGRPADPAVHYLGKYLDLPTEPLFPFGHGLSYSRFKYAGLRVEPALLSPDGEIEIELFVTNEGPLSGEETLFLFVHDPVATIARPLLDLKGTSKITLEPGARGRVRFRLAAADLAYLGADLAPRLDAGVIEFLVGPSAAPRDLLATTVCVMAAPGPRP